MNKRANAPQLLGPLEIEVMRAVWELGDATVAEVVEQLRPQRSLHHNTIMTIMNRLTQKRLLRRYARDGRTHGFQPRVSREEMSDRYMQVVVDQFFGGSVPAAITGFLGMHRGALSKKISTKKAAQLEKILEQLQESDEENAE